MRRAEEVKWENTPAVSVVIPVYNAQKYLGQMMESVRCQTLREIEVICIDDGSTDGSAQIIRGFMKKDPRIRLIRQENLNAGMARNRGLLEASGKYVVFWDADDRFQKNTAELLYRRSEEQAADVCVCGVCEFTSEGKVYEADGYLKTKLLPPEKVFSRKEIGGQIFNFASNVLWNKMFRRGFLMGEEIRFQDIRQGNDTAFVMLSMYLAEAVTWIDRKLVYHRVNEMESLTGRSSETVFCPYESYLFTLRKLEQYPEFPEVAAGFRNKAAMGMFRALNIQTSYESYVKLYEFLKEEGLEALGLYGCRREDLEEEWIYRDLELMKKASAGEFLLHKANERRWDRDQLKYTLRRVRRRLSLLLALNQKIKEIRGFFRRT